MGQMFEPETNVQEFTPPHLQEAQDYFQNREASTPQMDVPDTPLSQQAGQDMSRSISQYGPEMEKFFFGMMQNGGLQNSQGILDSMQQRGQMNDQNTRAQVMSSQLPQGSTAQTRALGGELSQNALDRNIQMGNIELQQANQAMNRQFQGAQGLGSMPSYYGQPSSVEQAMFSMQTPYRMANHEAQMQEQSAQDQWMQAMGLMQPERVVTQEPSPWDQYVSPILNAAAPAVGMMIGGPMGAAAGAGLTASQQQQAARQDFSGQRYGSPQVY